MASATQKLLAAHPWCCFCGGSEKAVNLDHQPARLMFPDKHRPKGLEFPACAACNISTSGDEALVAFFARVTGNHRFPDGRVDQGLINSIKAVEHAFPNLLSTIVQYRWIKQNGLLNRRQVVNGNNPQVVKSACRVSAKLGLAAYYDHYKRSAESTVYINTMWTHNQNDDTRLSVDNILKTLPDQKYLKQGNWDTQDSFFLRYYIEGDTFFMVAILHESLALVAQISDPRQAKASIPWHHVWKLVRGKGILPLEFVTQSSLIIPYTAKFS
jgi:hypothetical protein